MSRSRRERSPDLVCGFDWESDKLHCAHVCKLPLGHDGDEHVCCGEAEGRTYAVA
jgi:hypothetical protein